jgi:hypothetical protein
MPAVLTSRTQFATYLQEQAVTETLVPAAARTTSGDSEILTGFGASRAFVLGSR